MLLLIGLGNIGSEYEDNRHNAGFLLADALVNAHTPPYAGSVRWTRLRHAVMTECKIGDMRSIVAKPTTMMNLSGVAAVELMQKWRVALTQVVVFHDELDLPLGEARGKIGGGHGGHNGIRSMINCIGADFGRVRIGIGHPDSPESMGIAESSGSLKTTKRTDMASNDTTPMRGTSTLAQTDVSSDAVRHLRHMSVSSYVLSDFAPFQRPLINSVLDKVVTSAQQWVNRGISGERWKATPLK